MSRGIGRPGHVSPRGSAAPAEPDVVIYPRASGLQGLTGPGVLLAVEIADSSLRYDIGRKAAL